MKPIHPLLICILLIGGCGYAFLPAATEKNVTKTDIVGLWQYSADFEKTTITLDLNADGTFVQTITRSGQTNTQVHSGNWDLEGTTPKLTLLKPVFGDASAPWILEEANWWIVDGYQDGVAFAIFGAADDRDPDSCDEFKKLR